MAKLIVVDVVDLANVASRCSAKTPPASSVDVHGSYQTQGRRPKILYFSPNPQTGLVSEVHISGKAISSPSFVEDDEASIASAPLG